MTNFKLPLKTTSHLSYRSGGVCLIDSESQQVFTNSEDIIRTAGEPCCCWIFLQLNIEQHKNRTKSTVQKVWLLL
jgi:hypothetical protein